MTIPNNQVIDRVRKLLALSQSPHQGEASNAMAKAQELLALHKLSIQDIETTTQIVEERVEIGEWYQVKEWKKVLAFAIAKFYHCQALVSRTTVFFVGETQDIEVLKEVYAWIQAQIIRLSDDYIKEYTGVQDKRRIRNSFFYGCVETIRIRLQANQYDLIRQNKDLQAIVHVSGLKVQKWIEGHLPDMSTYEHKPTITSRGFEEGVVAGWDIELGRPQRRLGSNKH